MCPPGLVPSTQGLSWNLPRTAAKWSNSTTCREEEKLQQEPAGQDPLPLQPASSSGLQLAELSYQLPLLTGKQVTEEDKIK